MKALLLMLAASVSQPQQFDLMCNQPAPDGGGIWAQANVHFRIDLASGRWCEGDCKVINPLADVQPSSIWFDKSTDQEDSAGLTHFREVDRQSGEYTWARNSGMVSPITEKAVCASEPFSGFPTLKTKF